MTAVRPGTIIVNAGTCTPGNAVRAAELSATSGAVFLDAPFSGGRMGAEARTLITLVGGSTQAFEAAEPIFESYSAHVLHCGDHGAGQLVLDMDLFGQAMADAGIDASETTARGIAGASSLASVVALLNPDPAAATASRGGSDE